MPTANAADCLPFSSAGGWCQQSLAQDQPKHHAVCITQGRVFGGREFFTLVHIHAIYFQFKRGAEGKAEVYIP